ncbi:MAG: heavy-metal-associated domain-containing protein, partial [Phycisphaerae bacterium]|nr:heavy-metal-associated domain-containing protein [Phycisphaerae bacterium]
MNHEHHHAGLAQPEPGTARHDAVRGEAVPSAVAPSGALARAELSIEGMTCASCAARIERRLKRQPGVASAGVNFVTHVATVNYDPAATGPAALVKAVDDLGYKAAAPSPDSVSTEAAHRLPHDHSHHSATTDDDHSAHMNVGPHGARRLLIRTIVGAAFAAP